MSKDFKGVRDEPRGYLVKSIPDRTASLCRGVGAYTPALLGEQGGGPGEGAVRGERHSVRGGHGQSRTVLVTVGMTLAFMQKAWEPLQARDGLC